MLIRLFIPSILLSIALVGCNGSAISQSKTNVVLILADDQGYGDIGFHGNEIIQTPILDSLTNVSFYFEDFYVSPVCAPTRASLLTGRYAYRTGTHNVSNGMENMNPDEYTLAELFVDNGYKTAAFGKWHNGSHYPFHPNQQGFQRFIGFCMGHWNNYFNSVIEENGESILAKGFLADYLTDRAIQFIDENKTEPFFCYVPYNTPHSPFQVPDRYFNKYKKLGLDDKTACVYGMCENIDDNVGKILYALDRNEILENTIVIYMSDNGPVPGRFNGNLRGNKGQLFEGGVKVPCLMHVPQKLLSANSNNGAVKGIAAHVDIMPTLLDLLNLNMSQKVDFDGVSLLSQLNGQRDTAFDKRILYTKLHQKEPNECGGALRTGNYRMYIMRNKDTMLFNLAEDPYEQNNLKNLKPDLTALLAEKYYNWIDSVLTQMPSFTAIPVGVDGQQVISMPAHEAVKTDGVQWEEGHGWANDWLNNFSSANDSIFWGIEVEQDGVYQVSIDYALLSFSQGDSVSLSTHSNSHVVAFDKVFDPKLVLSPDRFKRKEAMEQTWGTMQLGTLELTRSNKYISIKLVGEFPLCIQIKKLVMIRTKK